ncbi:hypothetical protein [Azospirillum argentinense]|uniref:ClpX C4-type zinc finger protein n=1 Tax=Azospirillum argentinense TaxID=2970906 RepID=UPI0032DFDBE9
MAWCDFCGKDESEVAKLIAGAPNLHICNECVTLCGEIVADNKPAEAAQRMKRRGGAEVARLRLQAFAIVANWGSKDADGVWKAWTLDSRMAEAERLTEWALAESLTVCEAPPLTDPVGGAA